MEKLTRPQISSIEKVLNLHNPDDLTESTALSISGAFDKAGIEPSDQLSDALEIMGFDPDEFKKLVNIGKQSSSVDIADPASTVMKKDSLSHAVDGLSRMLSEHWIKSNIN